MKILSFALLLSFLSLSSFSQDTQALPRELRGTVDAVFCGNIYDLSFYDARAESCLIYIKNKSDGLGYAVFSSENAYLTILKPSDEKNEIIVGRIAEFYLCEAPEGRYSHFMEVRTPDPDYTYIDCHSQLTKLVIEPEDVLESKDIAGRYQGRSKISNELVEAYVHIHEAVTDQPSLFPAPNFKYEVLYSSESSDEIGLAIQSSEDLQLAKKPRASFFYGSYVDDCQDPDCFNTDGDLRFIKNAGGGYTLFLEFEHYNAAPSGKLGVGRDFEEKVFLKRVGP